MAIIPLFRTFIFILTSVFSLVVLGISARIEYLVSGTTNVYLSFAPFGLATSCVTILSLPLLLVLGNLRNRVFTSMILFEIIWFFLLWVLWVGTASDAVAGRAYYFPLGCVENDYYPVATEACTEFTIVEAFAFLNFFCAFIYYDVIFLYAIISAIRGRSIWFISVKEAITSDPVPVKSGVPVIQPQFNAGPAGPFQNYGGYPPNVPPYPQQVPPQGSPSQQYSPYLQQVPPQDFSTFTPGQNQPYNYLPSPSAPQQLGAYTSYSPSQPTNNIPLPPHPNYGSRPASGLQPQLPLPSGHQGQPQPSYGSQPILV